MKVLNYTVRVIKYSDHYKHIYCTNTHVTLAYFSLSPIGMVFFSMFHDDEYSFISILLEFFLLHIFANPGLGDNVSTLNTKTGWQGKVIGLKVHYPDQIPVLNYR